VEPKGLKAKQGLIKKKGEITPQKCIYDTYTKYTFKRIMILKDQDGVQIEDGANPIT
jgi:hypothetical protein